MTQRTTSLHHPTRAMTSPRGYLEEQSLEEEDHGNPLVILDLQVTIEVVEAGRLVFEVNVESVGHPADVVGIVDLLRGCGQHQVQGVVGCQFEDLGFFRERNSLCVVKLW